ncbi:ceramide glucosyltransferase-like [Lineus longissimus]|uniref:ceramide glucosyltransferase-like n=1 Tax=Lineus longissimus TaxID=88925 RepID=UPI002B4DFDC0
MIYGKWRLYQPIQPLSPEEGLPAVSIIKPLTGVDPNLYHNLETFFTMKYPVFELLFCVYDEIDPVIMVVQSLMSKYPKIPAKLLIGGKNVGMNPKVNNMVQGYDVAQHGLILISDSGIRMKEDTLLDMVTTMLTKENCGMVHQMPYVCQREGFSSVLEAVYFGTQHAKMYLTANMVGINCTTGMSCVFRKDIIDEAGGLAHFGQYLAEDYFLAKAFLDRGYCTRISSQLAWQNHGNYSVAAFQARMVRWTKLRTAMLPHTIILEPLSECLWLGTLSSLVVTYLLGWNGIVFFLTHCLCWFILDYILLKVINNGPLPFSKFDFLVAWLFREIASPYLLIKSQISNKIHWRHRSYVVRWGGYLEELHEKARV